MINFSNNIFHLSGKSFSYQIEIDKVNTLLHSYFDRKIEEEVKPITALQDRGFSGNVVGIKERSYSYDSLPLELPTVGMGDYRTPALSIENSDGSITSNFKFKDYEIVNKELFPSQLPHLHGKGGETLVIKLVDNDNKMECNIYYVLYADYDAFARYLEIKNISNETKMLYSMASASVDIPFGDYDALTFTGRHCFERQMKRQKIESGIYALTSRRGTSSHQANPAVIIAERDATEKEGEAFSIHLAYSGSFRFSAEKDQYNSTRIVMGMGDDNMPYTLESGETLFTPQAIFTYSDKGFSQLTNKIAALFEDHLLRHVWEKENPPVLINNWEATYFDFNGEKLISIAREAKKLGVDLFVLDDGWFGERNDDNSSLGDWIPNEEKLQMPLSDLVTKIHKEGLKFGLWIEPEMISRNSKLYREHPEYALQTVNQEASEARGQLVLDMSNEEAYNTIEKMFDDIFDNCDVDYIKWDMNRSLSDIYSLKNKTKRGNTAHRFVLQTYRLLDHLRTKYPSILIEGCSGGGGRFDAGMLYYTPQIWLSDNTDAVNRAKIQYDSSYLYPTTCMGAHISAVPNHQTGRITPLKTRSNIAFMGTYGLELDPERLTDDEKAVLKTEISRFKELSSLTHNAALYRLRNDEYITSWLQVKHDKKEALLTALLKNSEGNPLSFYVKLQGLDSDAEYKLNGRTYKGSTLMNQGVALCFDNTEHSSISWLLKRV